MRTKGLVVSLSIAGLLSGCELLNPPAPGNSPDFAPTYPVTPDNKQGRVTQGAIYNAETALPLFETPRARHAGDIVTVLLVEKTDAQKKATTMQTKNDKSQIVNGSFLGRPIALGAGYSLDFDLNAKRQFMGDARSIQNNKLAGSISVTVAKVLANGSMLIQGEKWVSINQGHEYVRVSGMIRPQDISPDNTVRSDRIANARIAYGGTGQINNVNAQGWFSRFIWGPFFPE
ncbi:flagellar basal body L-ring protein [Legionella taurinensis]|uniref:Flagellar L-ring protein n=1 Tax=Legionella taurinensis TaxID=70611 RepID=A0A3A5L8A7_9GAMM|nr:flagellar basal body L-ring protein FlgH [Legionella taurinensis]MDX1837088.1 flagellar basal body L-ring protein FlgH [Legionella taurinensis]PUT40425.1 flagellar basal body L-ring protein [Legionella taurinensis]PUT40483.1 flagellar basal body L-ring protein [Legionella taurinensis]PUT42728.1 flagellar basal body L-ring protein [Legionella taurinensis]PUT48487.1 flagellar basal body L-ring protein [Legionella taurinensis]